MKKLLLLITLLICCRDVMAQKVVERKNKLTNDVIERFDTYIESDKQIKHGKYQALYRKKKIIANGKYDNDKKVGVWSFFDQYGKLMQNYDCDANKLLYEDPEGPLSGFSYAIDDTIEIGDKATQPVRIGGRYFGYLPYVKAFKLPSEFIGPDAYYTLNFELLISPMGRLADMLVHIDTGPHENDRISYSVDIDRLPTDDKIFIPATLNGKPVASRVNFRCRTNEYGNMELY